MSLYVTLNEYKQAPTAIDITTLDQTNLGNQAAQDAALLEVLKRASSWVDNICKQILQATNNVETKEVTVTRDGRIVIHPNNVPIINLTNFQFRNSPMQSYTVVDLNEIEVYENYFSVYILGMGFLLPNLQLQPMYFNYSSPFQMQRLTDIPLTAQYTYTNGFANATLTATADAGATTIQVDNATGFTVGNMVTIYDGANEENVTVSSVVGNTVTLQNPLLFAHNTTGVAVSALPSSVKEATILLASYLIKERGSLALSMGETTVTGTTMGYNRPSDIQIAKEMLKPYVRVVIS